MGLVRMERGVVDELMGIGGGVRRVRGGRRIRCRCRAAGWDASLALR